MEQKLIWQCSKWKSHILMSYTMDISKLKYSINVEKRRLLIESSTITLIMEWLYLNEHNHERIKEDSFRFQTWNSKKLNHCTSTRHLRLYKFLYLLISTKLSNMLCELEPYRLWEAGYSIFSNNMPKKGHFYTKHFKFSKFITRPNFQIHQP